MVTASSSGNRSGEQAQKHRRDSQDINHHVSWHQCWSRQEVLAKAQETMNMQHLTFFLQMTCTPLDVLSDTQYNRYPRKHDSLFLCNPQI